MSSRFLILIITFLICTQLAFAQSKTDRRVMQQLRADIGYLAADSLEGRRTGTEGERKAAAYIQRRYAALKITPYKGQYLQPFQFVYGKEVGEATYIKIQGNTLRLNEDMIPLPFSANKSVTSEVMANVLEQGNIWLVPLYGSQEEADDAHYDWEKNVYERCKEAIKQGATGILFYDSYDSKYPPTFISRSEYETLDIPVGIITYTAYQRNIENHHEDLHIEMRMVIKKTERTGNNVAAFIDNGAKYTVVIGAHYDHLGYGEDGNSLHANAVKEQQIHNGADDNASGTAALLELAARIKKNKLKQYNYLFVHFSGEELGLFGSKAFVKDMGLDSNSIAYMINMDMVGRLNDSTHALTVGGVGTSPTWGQALDMNTSSFKINLDSAGVGPSDHTSFYYAGVPVLFFFTGTHKDYHKPTDDADKINYAGEVLVINYIYSLVAKMEQLPKPIYTTTKQSTVGKVRFKVTLGIMPDYSFQEGGVRVDGVSDDRPAANAGVKAGDIITQIGPHEIQGMQSYMETLGKFNVGDKTQVKVKRGTEELTLPLEFTPTPK